MAKRRHNTKTTRAQRKRKVGGVGEEADFADVGQFELQLKAGFSSLHSEIMIVY